MEPSDNGQENKHFQLPQIDVMEWLKEEAENVKDNNNKYALFLFEIARELEKKGSMTDAVKIIEQAINADPELKAALWEALRLYREKINWNKLIDILKKENQLPISDDDRIENLTLQGEIYEDWLEDEKSAVDLYKEAQKISKIHPLVLLNLGKTYAKQGDKNALADILESQIETTNDEQRKAALISELAKLYLEINPEGYDKAINLYKKATELQGEKWLYLNKIELISDRAKLYDDLIWALKQKATISESLLGEENIKEKANNLGALIDGEDGARNIATMLWRRIALLEEHNKGNKEEALTAINNAIKLSPRDSFLLYEKLRILKLLERYDEVEKIAGEFLAEIPSPLLAATIHIYMAELCLKIGKIEEAKENLQASLQANSNLLSSWFELEQIYINKEDWDSLINMYMNFSEKVGSDDILKNAILLRAAELKEEFSNDLHGALNIYQTINNNKAFRKTIWIAEARLLHKLEKWKELCELYEWLAQEVVDHNWMVSLLTITANLKIVKLNDEQGAVNIFEKIIEKDPNFSWPWYRIARYSLKNKQWEKASKAYIHLAEQNTQIKSSIYYFLAAISIYKDKRNRNEAITLLKKSIDIYPQSIFSFYALKKLLTEGHELKEIESIVDIRKSSLPEEKVRYFLELAWQFEKENLFKEAGEIYNEIINEDNFVGNFAIFRLIIIYLKEKNYGLLITLLEEKIIPKIDTEDIIGIKKEIAYLYLDYINDINKAENILKEILESQPNDNVVLITLLEIYLSNNRFQEAKEILLKLSSDSEIMNEPWIAELILLLFIGEENSIEIIKKASDLAKEKDKTHKLALIADIFLIARQKNSQEKIKLREVIQNIEGDSPINELINSDLFILKLLYLDKYPEVDLKDKFISPNQAALYSESSEIKSLFKHDNIDIIKNRVAVASQASEIFWKIVYAYLLEKQQDYVLANKIYKDIIINEPKNILALLGIIRVSYYTQKWEDATTYLETLGEIIPDSQWRENCWKGSALLWLKKLNNKAKAIQCWQKVMDINPANKECFNYLYLIFSQENKTDEILNLLEKRIDSIDIPDELENLFWKQAKIYVGMNDIASALMALDNLSLFNETAEVLRAKVDLFLKAGKYPETVDVLESLMLKEETKEAKIKAINTAVSILEKRLNQPKRALENLIRLIEYVPSKDLYLKILSISRKLGDWNRATWALGKLAEITQENDVKIEYLKGQAQMYIKRLKDNSGAGRVYSEILKLNPGDTESLKLFIENSNDIGERYRVLNLIEDNIYKEIESDLFNSLYLENLSIIFDQKGEKHKAISIKNARYVLGQLSGKEIIDMEDYIQNVSIIPSQRLNYYSIDNLLPDPGFKEIWSEVIKLIGPFIGDIFGLNYKSIIKKVDPDSFGNIKNQVLNLATVLGMDSIKLYRGGLEPSGFTPIPGEDYSLAIGDNIKGNLNRIELFKLGHILWLIRNKAEALYGRNESEIVSLFVAAWQEGKEIKESPIENIPGQEIIRKEFHKAMPRKLLKMLSKMFEPVSQLSKEVLHNWIVSNEISGYRVGILFCGDISSAFKIILPTWNGEDERGRQESVGILKNNLIANKLLQYSISREFFSLRRETGI